LAAAATPLLVTSYDGRPIKVEGNPLHPFNLGACDRFAQASLLELYDPDRSAVPVERTPAERVTRTWEDFAGFCRERFSAPAACRGRGLAVVAEASSSPTLARLKARLRRKFPEGRWFEYEPLSRDNEREGTAAVFGVPYRTHFALDRAQVIAAFDADLLLAHPAALSYARQFAAQRTAQGGEMNRLYAVECAYSVTGAAADRRFPLAAALIGPALVRLLAELVVNFDLALPPQAGNLGGRLTAALGSPLDGLPLRALARDLREARGRGVIAVGPRQPPLAHALACLLNEALGNVGQTVFYTPEPDPERPSHMAAIREVAEAMRREEVDTLLVLGGNPAYDSPADLEFAQALEKVPVSVHLSLYEDETSQLCTWHLPRAHYLEAWGDVRTYDGTISIVQPLIEPLFAGKSAIEVLSMILDENPRSGYELVRETFDGLVRDPDRERAWRVALHDGLVANSAFSPTYPTPKWEVTGEIVGKLLSKNASEKETLEIVFGESHASFDGRFATNAWLQELPDPLTKLAWDNAAIVGPQTARSLGVDTGAVLRLSYRGRELEIPAYVMPGQAEDSVFLALGHGRRSPAGRGSGFDAYRLRHSASPHFDRGLRALFTGRRYRLACTQEHHIIDALGRRGEAQRLGRLVREGTLEEYRSDPEFARRRVHEPPLRSLWQEQEFSGHRWGMAIDLTACIGCNACVIACQAENNVPVVGKENVAVGREMHWIRIDRYFSGSADRPRVLFQPVACHQCEHAPCEEVCPVAATQHSQEGLNEMVYNRCIGTRYCSNNCPYKVRRFNYFNYHTQPPEIEKMLHNPEVTVRSRGVMEKCTYCVQRISAAKVRAGNERRPIRDGEITPACAQTCPTQAIVFGDLADPQSRVAKLRQSPRAYAMLAELNVRPRTHYLAKLRNPSEEEKTA